MGKNLDNIPRPEVELDRVARAWDLERRGARSQFNEERRRRTLSQRVEQGIALRDLSVAETGAAPGGRTRLRLKARQPESLRDTRIGQGDPVVLWWEEPSEPEALRAVVAQSGRDGIEVVTEGDPPDRFLDEDGFRLDLEAPETTFDRGRSAIESFRNSRGATAKLWKVLCGAEPPAFSREREWTPLDADLEERQRQAVAKALSAEQLSLVLGPPGTGKTRTLTEIVRQAVARGERVLVTAASHTAVDNLVERLAAAGVDVVRLGHPARVSPAVEALTLDARLEATGSWGLAREWVRQANELRRQTYRRSDRGSLSRDERRAALDEVRRLVRDARKILDSQRGLIAAAPVVASTAAGAEAALLSGSAEKPFDLVVLDEATQCPDPVAMVALLRAPRAVLAGDPHQLPPTVVDSEALRLGLGTTFFERLAAGPYRDQLVTVLRRQHRMHRDLMRFPSEATYGGDLVAAPQVESACLEDLSGVSPDESRPGPFVLIDSAGRGWDELESEDDPSLSNPDQADRTAAEVRRLIGRGVSPAEIAVITPYYAQVRGLRDRLRELVDQGLEVSTVDAFQGREKTAVIVDLVRSNTEGRIGFLSDIRRTNVAITRARRFLLVMGDSATLGGNAYYAKLFGHAEESGAWKSAWEDDGV